MYRLRFYAGTENTKESGLLESVRKDAEGCLNAIYGGFTRFDGEGSWVDGGKVYRESSDVYEVLKDTSDYADYEEGTRVARILRNLYLQKSVLYTLEHVKGEFVNA